MESKELSFFKRLMKTKAKATGYSQYADQWVMEWLEENEDDVSIAYEHLKRRAEECLDSVDDTDLCPFCYIYYSYIYNCSDCPWKEQNGHCSDPDSIYQRSTHQRSGTLAIVEQPDVRELLAREFNTR